MGWRQGETPQCTLTHGTQSRGFDRLPLTIQRQKRPFTVLPKLFDEQFTVHGPRRCPIWVESPNVSLQLCILIILFPYYLLDNGPAKDASAPAHHIDTAVHVLTNIIDSDALKNARVRQATPVLLVRQKSRCLGAVQHPRFARVVSVPMTVLCRFLALGFSVIFIHCHRMR